MRSTRHSLLLLPALLLTAGCVQIQETLTINADGSGTLEMVVGMDEAPDQLTMMQHMPFASATATAYPPTTKMQAEKLFPGDAFEVETEQRREGKKHQTRVRVRFKSVDDLMRSPYGRLQSLIVSRDDRGALTVDVLPALRGHYRLKDVDLSKAQNRIPMPMPIPAEMLDGKVKLDYQFTLQLPNPITRSSGKTDGQAATWTVHADTPRKQALAVLDAPMRATCSGRNVTFTPAETHRLDRLDFAAIKEGPIGVTRKRPSAAEVNAAVRFVPCWTRIVRSTDMIGAGMAQNTAELTFMAVLPVALQPDAWGKPEVESVKTDNGWDVTKREEGHHFSHHGRFMPPGMHGEEDEAPKEVRKQFSIPFDVPPRQSKALKVVKARVPVSYYSGVGVIKLPKAITADMIAEGPEGMMGFRRSRTGIEHPELKKRSIHIHAANGMRVDDAVMLMLQLQDEMNALQAVRLYDADGKFVQALGGVSEWSGWSGVLPAEPKLPLSMVMVLKGGGEPVQLDVRLTDLSLEPTPTGSDASGTKQAR